MSVNSYHAPEELQVDCYFKKNPFFDWSFPQYYEWKKRLNPFNENFNKVQKEYNNNLEIIKKSSLVHRDVKSQIQLLKKFSKVNTNRYYVYNCKSANVLNREKLKTSMSTKL